MQEARSLTAPVDWSNFNSSLLIEVTRPEGVFTSSGVAISPWTVLTAAHCLAGTVLKVRVSFQPSYHPSGDFIAVDSFELHPEYNQTNSNYQCDLGKIRLKSPLPKTTNYFPIIKSSGKIEGKILRIGYGSRYSKNIRTLVTPAFKALHEQQSVLELSDVYSYSGDSGGPVFLQQGAQMYLVAIHSTLSFGPEGKYSFNPLLSKHRDWIQH